MSASASTAFAKYDAASDAARAASSASPSASASSTGGSRVLANATVLLSDAYKRCNPSFGYTPAINPRRQLTKPSKPCGNDGHDNENQDLIISVNDVLAADDGSSPAFVVTDVLGSGTFGQVVRCREKGGAGVSAAVKVIKNHPAYFHQAHVEIGILHMLNQECDQRDENHIVRMLSHFVHRSHLCIVFEVLNINLYELLRQNKFKGLAIGLVRVFVSQLLDALRVLRLANVIHCDLKPENILIKNIETAEIKLIDFGSACFQNRTVYQYIQSRFYRSPEVVLGSPYGMPIDVWSLGCVAAELFLGLPLFPGASEYNLLTRMCETLGPPPSSMLASAANAHKFFKKNESTGGGATATGGLSAAIGGGGGDSYELYTLDEYEQKSGKKVAMGKRYFKHTLLNDVVHGARMSSSASEEAQMKERADRASLLDLLHGLLELDPKTRWTPDQAKAHPFVRDAPFAGPGSFVPPPPEEVCVAKEVQAAREQAAARAAASVTKRGPAAAATAAAAAEPEPEPEPAAEEPRTPERATAAPAATSGGLAAALAASSSGSDPAAAQIQAQIQAQAAFLQQQQQQQAAAMAAQQAASFSAGSFTGTPGSYGSSMSNFSQYGMSPHAMNSAALHPLHFGQSPPSSAMSAMVFAEGMQHAAAAAAAAAVQLPTLMQGSPANAAMQWGFHPPAMPPPAFGGGGAPGPLDANALARRQHDQMMRRSSVGAGGNGWAGPHAQSAPRVGGGGGGGGGGGASTHAASPNVVRSVGFNAGGSPSSARGRRSPRATPPGSFKEGSLSQTRGYMLNKVDEDGDGDSSAMEYDDASSGGAPAAGGGMGDRRGSREAMDAVDPSDWDPNFANMLDGEQRGGMASSPGHHVGGGGGIGIPGAAREQPRRHDAGGGGGGGGPGGATRTHHYSASAPKWTSSGMTGRQHPAAGAFGMAQQPMGPPGDFPGFNPNPPPMHPMAFHQFQQQQRFVWNDPQQMAAAAMQQQFAAAAAMGAPIPPGGWPPAHIDAQGGFANGAAPPGGLSLAGLTAQPANRRRKAGDGTGEEPHQRR